VPDTQTPQPDPLLYDLHKASQFTGLTVWQLRGLIAHKRLAVVTVGKKFFIRKSTLVRWAENAEHKHKA
jgi:hypothetical protein